jgi:HNH endonuclease
VRPVDKGSAPRDANDQEILYSGEEGHQLAKAALYERLGRYCSYCERKTDLHVEHVIPKRKHPDVKHLWANYLLACGNCNSIKSEKDTLTEEWDCFFPDEINTLWAFEYGPGARVVVQPRFTNIEDQRRAQNTIDMVGLDRNPVSDSRARDLRWQDRDSAWEQALDALNDLIKEDTLIVRKRIFNEAIQTGFFSIWWTVFGLDTDANRRTEMRRELIARFGAHAACFNDDGSVRESLARA